MDQERQASRIVARYSSVAASRKRRGAVERDRPLAAARKMVLVPKVHPGGGLPPGDENPEAGPAGIADAHPVRAADDLEEPSCLTRQGSG